MTAEEFRVALRVLAEGRPKRTIYEVEDAKAVITPVKRAYWRMFVAVSLISIIPFSVLFAFSHGPAFLATPVSMALPILLLSMRAFRDKFMPVRGLQADEIIRAAMK